MLTAVTMAALLVLVAVGVWQLSTARLTGTTAKRTAFVQDGVAVFSVRDVGDPRRILADRGKLLNAAILVAETLTVTVAVWLVTVVAYHPQITVPVKGILAGGLLVGAFLIGQAMYVRFGLYHPDLDSPADYRRSLSVAIGDGVGEDFVDVREAAATARGGDVDDVTASVVAAANHGVDVDTLARWGDTAGVADPDRFHERARTLADADLLTVDDGRLRIDDTLEDADSDQVASAVASVLS